MDIESAYKIFCKKRFPLPSENQVVDLERRIGVPLPPDFRGFLLKYNGGIFREPDIIPQVEGCPLDGLTWLSGIGTHDSLYEFCSPADLALFDGNDPLQIVPCGYTIMGNLIFLVVDPNGDDWGGLGLKMAYSDKSFHLGDNIGEFFKLLREPGQTNQILGLN